MKSKKIAIVLFNLGGPDSLKTVKPFLFNLFYDKAIINLPNPFRYVIAKLISIIRNKKSQKIYSFTGNKSPLFNETIAQKLAISNELKKNIKEDFEIFIIMRYFSPRAIEIVKKIEEYEPSEVILLPLYPQFSSITTGSSVKEFFNYFNNNIIVKTICCYNIQEDFIKAYVILIKEKLNNFENINNLRILFSAHSLPKKVIESGDPYQWQVEETVKEIVKKMEISDLDYKITYQSKVGPVQWIKPNTEDEVVLAGKQKKDLIIVPVAFVSEHVETLVELDKEYKILADKYMISYVRVSTLRTNKNFIDGIIKILLVLINTKTEKNITLSGNTDTICPQDFIKCLSKKQ